jgi:hypothetical protein
MDNRYYKYNCPPLMNDGRFLSSYIRSRVFDQYIRNINNVHSAQEYKHFLQNNGDQIINNLKGYFRESSTCRIEGKCLPMAGPNSNDVINYLNSNDRNQNNFFSQIINDDLNSNTDLNSNIISSNNSSNLHLNGEDLSAQKAQEMAKNIYARMVYEQQQQNISDMNIIKPSNANS